MEPRKRIRVTFSRTQKLEVLRYQDPHPKTSQQAITIGNILQQNELFDSRTNV